MPADRPGRHQRVSGSSGAGDAGPVALGFGHRPARTRNSMGVAAPVGAASHARGPTRLHPDPTGLRSCGVVGRPTRSSCVTLRPAHTHRRQPNPRGQPCRQRSAGKGAKNPTGAPRGSVLQFDAARLVSSRLRRLACTTISASRRSGTRSARSTGIGQQPELLQKSYPCGVTYLVDRLESIRSAEAPANPQA